MTRASSLVETSVRISGPRAYLLHRLADRRGISEEQVVEKALDILFSLTDLFGEGTQRAGWTMVSETSLQRVWDNDADAAYDQWKDLYDTGRNQQAIVPDARIGVA